VFGALAWEGKCYLPGSLVAEAELYGEARHHPVVLEFSKALPARPGHKGYAGRWRQLFILWQWSPGLSQWRELGRAEDMPLDSAPELRQLAARAIRQDVWRATESVETAADRIHALLEAEMHELGDRRPEVLAILHGLVVARMADEEVALMGRPSRKIA
jgi:hypothetical protein